MVKISQKILEESPLNILATSPLAYRYLLNITFAEGEAGAFRSSVFEINKSSSIVNFITHVWSCCSDLLFADWACGPEGRQQALNHLNGIDPLCVSHSDISGFCEPEIFRVSLKTKHVSVIDVDPCIEVRC